MTFIIGTPHTHNAGYLRNDDSPSGGKLTEADIQTCPHCQKVINMQEWKTARVQNFCNRCMKPTCDLPMCVQDCLPYVKQVDLVHDALIKYQQHLRIAGLEPSTAPNGLVLPG